MRRAGQSRSCQLLNDRLPFHRRSKWAWTGPISRCPVTWELTGTHSIPACGTLADQRRISTFLNQILASDGSRFRLPRPAIFDDLRSHCSVLLSPIQPLLPVEGKPAFQISLRSRIGSDVLGRVAVTEDENRPATPARFFHDLRGGKRWRSLMLP
jgi:hypothetical protein